MLWIVIDALSIDASRWLICAQILMRIKLNLNGTKRNKKHWNSNKFHQNKQICVQFSKRVTHIFRGRVLKIQRQPNEIQHHCIHQHWSGFNNLLRWMIIQATNNQTTKQCLAFRKHAIRSCDSWRRKKKQRMISYHW